MGGKNLVAWAIGGDHRQLHLRFLVWRCFCLMFLWAIASAAENSSPRLLNLPLVCPNNNRTAFPFYAKALRVVKVIPHPESMSYFSPYPGNSTTENTTSTPPIVMMTRSCAWIQTHPTYCRDVNFLKSPSRLSFSSGYNSNLMKSVGETCPHECPAVSGCWPPYPSTKTSPYNTPETASERVVLPEPPVPNQTWTSTAASNNRTNCPHQLPLCSSQQQRSSATQTLIDTLPRGVTNIFQQSSSGSKTTACLVLWHDPATWGGSLPTEGQEVTLPPHTRVLIQQTVAERLGVIHIPVDSELVIGEHDLGIALDVQGIDVLGTLTLGSETCPLERPVTVTLHGSRPNELGAVGALPTHYKGISVEGGTLQVHGKRYYRTWTRLAHRVEPGDMSVVLQHPVNWEVGQEIVLVTSSLKDSRDFNQNEVATIAGVHPNPPAGAGAVVYLTAPAQYPHIANTNYQVEVGLLSRMIKIQGSADDSELLNSTHHHPVLDGLGARVCKVNSQEAYYGVAGPPCDVWGFGGHVMVHFGGVGQVQGVELYRMGQTNVMGRYPMHFHVLGSCPTCYFAASSVHHSYYRCVSIHGTNATTITENVAYDVTGFCYYLEDGVEQDTVISFNLAAHIHTLGQGDLRGFGQRTPSYNQSTELNLPADVSASGFYITNVHNYVIGNAASGGFSGFAFPTLATALQSFRYMKFRPANVVALTIDGNTAHSTGWWWEGAGAFYFGGTLFYNDDNILEYNPGRSPDWVRGNRRPCKVNICDPPANDCLWCPDTEVAYIRMTNTKSFLAASSGLNSWSGGMEIVGFEAHDVRRGIESLSDTGFWIDDMLVVCRTGEPLVTPTLFYALSFEGSGFFWYDTGQDHIITDSTFRNCGYRSPAYMQYDKSPTRGCGRNPRSGCSSQSSVFGFLTHANTFNPEVMQSTRNITFENCGRRFMLTRPNSDSVSLRLQNWVDVDGSASGTGEFTFMVSGADSSKDWWRVQEDVGVDKQGPLFFIKKGNSPQRALVHVHLSWDQSLHDKSGVSLCTKNTECPTQAYIRHSGPMFSPWKNASRRSQGYPVKPTPDVVGFGGGFGWVLTFEDLVPRQLSMSEMEIDPSTVLMISIPYPVGTQFEIRAYTPGWCWEDAHYRCSETFHVVGSVSAVRASQGNTYFVDEDGVLTFRLIEYGYFTGNPNWFVPNYTTPGRDGVGYDVPRFERDGVLLPRSASQTRVIVQARCPSDTPESPLNGYCPEPFKRDYDRDGCEAGYQQVAYDRCCRLDNPANCVLADGSRFN